MFGFLSLFCQCIYYTYLVCVYHEIGLYTIILSCWSLKYECILITLHFHYPHTFNVDIIFYLFLFCVSLNYLLWIEMILLLLPFNLHTSFISGCSTFTVYFPLQMRGFCCCCFVFLPRHTAYGILLVCWPGIEPVHSAVEAWSPNHWTIREFPIILIFLVVVFSFPFRGVLLTFLLKPV